MGCCADARDELRDEATQDGDDLLGEGGKN
jgi:hypothetical protein